MEYVHKDEIAQTIFQYSCLNNVNKNKVFINNNRPITYEYSKLNKDKILFYITNKYIYTQKTLQQLNIICLNSS